MLAEILQTPRFDGEEIGKTAVIKRFVGAVEHVSLVVIAKLIVAICYRITGRIGDRSELDFIAALGAFTSQSDTKTCNEQYSQQT